MRPTFHFEAAGRAFRTLRLSAMDQLSLTPILQAGAAAMASASEAKVMALAALPEAQLGAFLSTTLRGVEVRDGDDWRPYWSEADAGPAVADASLNEVVVVALDVLAQNLAAYIAHETPKFERRGLPSPSYTPVDIPGGKLWLMRPALRGLCQHVHLLDGSLDLADVALMNDAITVMDENESRVRKAAEDARQS